MYKTSQAGLQAVKESRHRELTMGEHDGSDLSINSGNFNGFLKLVKVNQSLMYFCSFFFLMKTTTRCCRKPFLRNHLSS